MNAPRPSASGPEVSILVVCMGNICRSPTAEAVLRRRLEDAGLGDRVRVDSAGTHAYHVGEPPDRRSCEAAARRGYDLERLRARALAADDRAFDLVLVMDRGNLRRARSTLGEHPGLRLFLGGAGPEREVPDPYAAGPEAFERVLDLLEEGADAIVDEVRGMLAARGGRGGEESPGGASGT